MRVKFKDIEKFASIKSKNFKQAFQGSVPTPFVGRYGYPKVNVGILSPQFTGDMEQYNSPKFWSKENLPIEVIAENRLSLVNARKSVSVKEEGKFIQICQEAGMAEVEAEVSLTKPPKLMISEDGVIPFGAGSLVEKARITSNPKVNSKIEKVVGDTDLKSSEAILNLYQQGFEETALSKLISVGNLGIKQNRKLVPTRWSITAVDDTVGKQLITEVKDFNVGEFKACFGGSWGNFYLLLFFPEVWSFELFETYLTKDVNPWSKQGYKYSTDHEDFNGRKNYAQETAGGYYAARLPVLEKMRSDKRQGSCLALRFITDYDVPLGVWVCREACRKSLENSITFSERKLMMKYAKMLVQRKFNFDIEVLWKESILLKERQTLASDFF